MFSMSILIKKSIPNFITLSNLFLGFVSIVLLALSLSPNTNNINLACYLILISTGLDVLDGKVARKLNISSEFGKEIDSLADLVSFCLCPSFLTFVFYYQILILEESLDLFNLILLSSFPLIFGAIRLAKYNAIKEMRESDKYLGLPTPANAILLCSLILFANNIFPLVLFGNFTEKSFFYNFFRDMILFNEYVILAISILSSMLLLSKINYEKFPLISFRINRRNNIDLIKMIFFLILLFLSVYLKFYELVLLFFILLYIYGNLIKHLIYKIIK